LGLADTAIVTRVGTTVDLGAIALSVLVFNFLYWAFGFLRMGTTGVAAQALGAGNLQEVQRTTKRAVLLGASFGLLLIVCASPMTTLALKLLAPAPDVATLCQTYIHYRIWGAPAVLINYAITGSLIALGHMRALLLLQLFLNVCNLVANLILVLWIRGAFEGVRGIALGTACAEWLSVALGLTMLSKSGIEGLASWTNWRNDFPWLVNTRAWSGLLAINLNILLRTFALLFGFAWFTRAGAQFGSDTLAANHLLQQFISFAAFFLDGVAFVTETFVGRAVGAKDERLLRLSVHRTSVIAALFALLLTFGVLLIGPMTLAVLAPTRAVEQSALSCLPFAAAYVLIGVVPWQLDGIFIGAADGVALRNAAVMSLVVFWVAAVTLSSHYGNAGLWSAMLIYIAMRGATLWAHWPRVVRRTRATVATPNPP
jgi:multidrug resistance protein, MATE family